MDHPRFEPVKEAEAQDRLHLAYHGGRAVELVFKAIDLLIAGWPKFQSAARSIGGAFVATLRGRGAARYGA